MCGLKEGEKRKREERERTRDDERERENKGEEGFLTIQRWCDESIHSPHVYPRKDNREDNNHREGLDIDAYAPCIVTPRQCFNEKKSRSSSHNRGGG